MTGTGRLASRREREEASSGTAPPSRRGALSAALVKPVDSSLLAVVRISFGAVIAWEMWRYVALDRPGRYFDETRVLFTYWPFDWVRPLPPGGMTVLFVVLAVLAVQVAVGALTRVSTVLLAVGLTYIFLLDRTLYLNHWYFACLLAVLLAVTPAGADLSVDARLRPERRRREVPAWTVQLLRFQVAIVYVYGGIAKLDAEWLAGRPLTMWLSDEGGAPLLGRLFVLEGAGTALAWASAAFDLAIVPLMLWGRTRRFAYPVAIAFHLLNARLFTIGMFPWLMILGTLVFFPPDMPRRMWSELQNGRHRVPTALGAVAVGAVGALWPTSPEVATTVVGALGGGVAAFHLAAGRPSVAEATEVGPAPSPGRLAAPLAVFLSLWVTVQLIVPLRHYAYPGDASWTEEGHQFAWRMMLRSKSGEVTFQVTDPRSGQSATVDPASVLSPDQLEQVATDPELLVQLARWLEKNLAGQLGARDLEVRARAKVSFNGRDPRLLVDPTVDLTEVDRPWLPPATWIRPRPTGTP